MKREVAEADPDTAVAHCTHFPDGIEIIGPTTVFFGIRLIIQGFREINDIADEKFSGTIIMPDKQTLVFGRVARSRNAEDRAIAEDIEFAIDIEKTVPVFFRHGISLFPDNDFDIRKIFEPIDMIGVIMGKDDAAEIIRRDVERGEFSDGSFLRRDFDIISGSFAVLNKRKRLLSRIEKDFSFAAFHKKTEDRDFDAEFFEVFQRFCMERHPSFDAPGPDRCDFHDQLEGNLSRDGITREEIIRVF